MILIDPRKTWWWEQQTQMRLTKWAVALLQGRPYSVRLVGKGACFILPNEHLIQINAQLFPKHSPSEQFDATQGLIAHEVGHAFFTQAWSEEEAESRLREMTNMLEDERIERCISIYYPGIAGSIRFLGDLMLERLEPFWNSPEEQAYLCCLTWRWACSRLPESGMLDRMEIGEEGRRLWAAVRPLVEKAWTEPNTSCVIKIAHQILEILKIDPASPPLNPLGLANDDLPSAHSEKAQPFPDRPCQVTQPGKGKGLEGCTTFEADTISKPAPFTELENQAAQMSNQLVSELRLPAPEETLDPDEWGGRYSFRQELRTPETPNLIRKGETVSSRGIAVHVLVDRSGSMSVLDDVVRLSLMAVYLACTELEIPIGISFFGADREEDQTFLVTPPLPYATEKTKALIAGFEGKTSYEFLDWGLLEAEASLATRKERLKIILVIHDGEPVYHGPCGDDWTLSHATIRRLLREGYLAIGLFLYRKDRAERHRGNFHKLTALFPNLVVSESQQFAEKLGNFLRSLSARPG